jgi:hypothetical protein
MAMSTVNTAVGGALSSASMGGAGMAAGGAAAGGGFLATMGALAGPLAIGGAILGGILAFSSANKRNKALRKSLIAKYAAYDRAIQDNRLAFYDQTNRNAKGVADELANTEMMLSGFGSGISNNEFIAQVESDKYADQIQLRRQKERYEQEAQIAKANARAEAQAGAVSPGLEALSGALGGASTGIQIGGALESLSTNLLNKNALNSITSQYKSEIASGMVSDNTLAMMSAVNAGVQPRLLTGREASFYLAPFQAGLQTNTINRQILQNTLDLSSLQLGYTRAMTTKSRNYFGPMTERYGQSSLVPKGNPLVSMFGGR